MKRAIIYARVSTLHQTEGYSLETQLDVSRRYAQQNGYAIVAEIVDTETGSKLERTGLDKIRAMFRNKEADSLIVHQPDRLNRSLVQFLLLKQELLEQGVDIIFASRGRAVSDTPDGNLLDNLEAMLAEVERERIKERTTRGRIGKVRIQGKILGCAVAPYGYKLVGSTENYQFEIVPEQAHVIQTVFELYCQGAHMASIAKKLSDSGYPTPGDITGRGEHRRKRGYAQWSRDNVSRIIGQRAYVGEMIQLRNPKYGDSVVTEVPSIVSRDLWDLAQSRRVKAKDTATRNRKHDYLLVGHIRCACGYIVRGKPCKARKNGNIPLYYACLGHQGTFAHHCTLPYIRIEKLDTLVWGYICEELLSAENLERDMVERQKRNEAIISKKHDDRRAIQAQIDEYDRMLEDILDMELSRRYPRDILDKKKAKLEGVLTVLKKQLDDLDQEIANIPEPGSIANVLALAEMIRAGIEVATFEEQRQLLDILDVKIVLEHDDQQAKVHITSYLSSKMFAIVLNNPKSTRSAACCPARRR